MFVRVVRFTDVSSERVQQLLGRLDEREGPPEGVPAKGIKFLIDDSQDTAVVLQYFETEDDMRKGAEVLDAMDSGDTPGTRASVDTCEVKAQLKAS